MACKCVPASIDQLETMRVVRVSTNESVARDG
jgi:hypothetical protein